MDTLNSISFAQGTRLFAGLLTTFQEDSPDSVATKDTPGWTFRPKPEGHGFRTLSEKPSAQAFRQSNNPSGSSRPVHEIRMGLINASISGNQAAHDIRQNLTWERRSRGGEEWKFTHSCDRENLQTLSKVADESH